MLYKNGISVIIYRMLAFVIGCSLVLSSFNYCDVGDRTVISLQSSVSSVTALSVYEPVQIPSVYEPDSEVKRSSHEDLNILKNTIVISQDEINEEHEIIDVSAFIYDGIDMWVSVNLANVREEPDVDTEIIEQLSYASEVIRISYGNSWSKVRTDDGLEGYILSSLLSDEEIIEPTATPSPIPTIAVSTSTPVPVVQSDATPQASYSVSSYTTTLYASCALNVRTGPGVNYSLVRVLSYGSTLNVTGQTNNGWYQLSDGNFVKADLCTSTQPQTYTPQESASNSFSDYCLQFVGTNYIYGGSSPSGFDCSGFVLYVYANYYGISLPHNAAEIALCGSAVTGDVQVGDVLCHDYNGDGYIEHCSIYIGNGLCIHASNSRSGVITSAWPMGAVVTIRRMI